MNEKSASIQLKLSKAKILLTEVDVILEHHFYITAVNRLYYSCYHATKALLLTNDYSDSMVVNTDEVKDFAEKSRSYIAYIELLLSGTFSEE
jgi:hypothetical protein